MQSAIRSRTPSPRHRTTFEPATVSIGASAWLFGDKCQARTISRLNCGELPEAPRSPDGRRRVFVKDLLAINFTLDQIAEARCMFSKYNRECHERRLERRAKRLAAKHSCKDLSA
jgi:hypothetical protein